MEGTFKKLFHVATDKYHLLLEEGSLLSILSYFSICLDTIAETTTSNKKMEWKKIYRGKFSEFLWNYISRTTVIIIKSHFCVLSAATQLDPLSNFANKELEIPHLPQVQDNWPRGAQQGFLPR